MYNIIYTFVARNTPNLLVCGFSYKSSAGKFIFQTEFLPATDNGLNVGQKIIPNLC